MATVDEAADPRNSGPADAADALVRDAFAEWIRPHWSAMTALALRLGGRGQADDIVQEALVLAWRKRAQYDPTRGTPRAWLLALIADQCRRAHRRRDRVPVPVEGAGEREPGPADRVADLDLQRALAGLPARQRLAVELYYFLGLPVAEAAQVMGCAVGTVKSTLSDARRALRAVLGDGRGGAQ